MENLETWNSIMKDRTDVKSCILIECPEEELERRILSRGQTSGRSDDTIETAKKRFVISFVRSLVDISILFRSCERQETPKMSISANSSCPCR